MPKNSRQILVFPVSLIWLATTAILPINDQIRESSATILTDIAEGLNAPNNRTARGNCWYPTTVKYILDRRQD